MRRTKSEIARCMLGIRHSQSDLCESKNILRLILFEEGLVLPSELKVPNSSKLAQMLYFYLNFLGSPYVSPEIHIP